MAKSDQGYAFGARDLEYIERVGQPVGAVFEAIEAAAQPEHVPILDRDSGRVLAVLAAGRRRILEIGTAFGYSTLWMAIAQPDDGRIVTIDPDRTRTDRARAWWRKADVRDERIQVVSRPALEAFADRDPALAGPFDLVFIDALKLEYPAYVEAVLPRLAPFAMVVADNVLWSGRVSGARETEPGDGSTAALRRFNESMSRDRRFRTAILPVGDGLLVAALLS
ncbi:MAG TPA: O-methyltransferase [Candidatus Saccharimonadales bacterium]|nr:O-methyltransferase [Candidatus Saccharimonadales bacterium]